MKMLITTTVAMMPPTKVAGIGEVGGSVLLSMGVGLGVDTAACVGVVVTTGVWVGMRAGAGGTLESGMVRTV